MSSNVDLIKFLTVPTKEYEDMMKELSTIKVSKRKGWKSWSKHASGQKVNIYYSSEPLIIQGNSGAKIDTHLYQKASSTCYFTGKQDNAVETKGFKVGDINVIPVISLDQDMFIKKFADEYTSTGIADNDLDMINQMYQHWADNATGNHHRNHSVKIKTRPGEPCRG